MTTIIYKYPLKLTDLQTILMPRGAEVLTVQVQGDKVYLWAIVDPELPNYEHVFEIVGTGHPLVIGGDVQRHYVATVQQGAYVWHVFERL